MSQIVAACHEKDVTCKVIFENCYLNDEEKIKLCKIAKEVKPDFIKTSTGFGTGGATFDDVKLMKEHVGDAVKVKAAGGIRDAKTFYENGRMRCPTYRNKCWYLDHQGIRSYDERTRRFHT